MTLTVLDDRLIPRVLAIVTRLGKTVIFHTPGDQIYDPATGEVSQEELPEDAPPDTPEPAQPVDYTKKVTPPEQYSINLIDGDLIKQGDMLVWLPGSGLEFVPAAGVGVTIDGLLWTVITVKPVYSGEQVVLYGLQLRK